MNIILPICANLVILALLITGIFVGKRNGFKYEFIKFIILSASIVGLFFLSPVITNLLFKLDFINTLASQVSYLSQAFNSIIFLILFLITYMFICLIIRAIRHHEIKKNALGVNVAKRTKVKGIDRKTSRQLKRDERRLNKQREFEIIKARSKKSKVFGAIFGFIVAVIIGFIVFLPVKYASKSLADAQQNPSIETVYEYTFYGQLDKLTGVYEFINNKFKGEIK